MKNIFISSPKRELGWPWILLMAVPYLIGFHGIYTAWLFAAVINNQGISVALGIILVFCGGSFLMIGDHFCAENTKKKAVSPLIGCMNLSFGTMLIGLVVKEFSPLAAWSFFFMVGCMFGVIMYIGVYIFIRIDNYIQRKIEARRKAHIGQSI